MENRKDELIKKIQEEESKIRDIQFKINEYRKELEVWMSDMPKYIGKYVTYSDGSVTHYTMLVKEQVYNNNSLLLKGFVFRTDIYRNNLLNSYNLINNGTICIPINGRNEKELKLIDKEKFDMFYNRFIESMMFSKKCFEEIDN